MQVGAIDQSVKEKKSNQRIVLQRGRNGEKREERQLERERSRRRGETRVCVNEGVRREKVKGREQKWKNLPWERVDAKNLCFPQLQTNIIFIGDATHERERERLYSKKKKIGKQPIVNKPYFY